MAAATLAVRRSRSVSTHVTPKRTTLFYYLAIPDIDVVLSHPDVYAHATRPVLVPC